MRLARSRLLPPIAALASFWAAGAGGCRTSGPPPAATPPPPEGPAARTISQAVFLNGRPLPELPVFSSELPSPARTFHVSLRAAGPGDGSSTRPWKDLNSALRSLAAGDRLVVSEGEYPGGIRIDGACS